MPLHVIQGGQVVGKRTVPARRGDAILQCPRCKSREVFVTVVGSCIQSGAIRGGTKSYLCAACGRNGQRVVLA